jgi:hypothetical protein
MKPPAWKVHISGSLSLVQLRQLPSQPSRVRRLDTCPCSFSEKGLNALVREGLDHVRLV